MDGAYRALDRLRSDKVIRGIGVGVNEAEMCERFARSGDFDPMLLAGRFSLLEQPALDSFLPLALNKGIGITPNGVFNSGILATAPVPGAKYSHRAAPPDVLARVDRIQAICREHGPSLADVALRCPFGHPAVAFLVLGAISSAGTPARRRR